jgi:undecaprenyl-diphosphatase
MGAIGENLQAAILGLVQGLTEFLPVSSTGHLVLAREVLGLGAGQSAATALAFDAVIQTATAFAIVLFYRRDLAMLGRGALVRGSAERAEARSLAVATLPAIALGLALESTIEGSLRGVGAVVFGLVAGSALLAFAEIAGRRRAAAATGASLSWPRALGVGVFQALALLPGMSRSGSTIAGATLAGFGRAAAARFAFLLGVPILIGSGGKKLLDIAADGTLATVWQPLLIASAVGLISGYLAIGALTRFLSTHTLWPFVWYRLALAAALALWVL